MCESKMFMNRVAVALTVHGDNFSIGMCRLFAIEFCESKCSRLRSVILSTYFSIRKQTGTRL